MSQSVSQSSEQASNSSKLKYTSSFLKLWNQCDFFGQPVQGFNHKGEKTITSGLGTVMSLLIAAIALIYAISKAHHIQNVNGQTISMYEDENDHQTKDNPLNLNEREIRIAFRFAKGYSPFYNIEDTRYVRTIVRLTGMNADTQQLFETHIPYHKCTDEDYSHFYPIRSENKDMLQIIRDDPEQHFLCLDWDELDPFLLIGAWSTTKSWQSLEFLVTPCNAKHTNGDKQGTFTVDKECDPDPQEQLKYTSTAATIQVLVNQKRFDPQKYGNERIIEESVILENWMNPEIPQWFFSNLQLQEVEDETEFIQFGQTENLEHNHLKLGEVQLSAWTDNLLEKPDGLRKFASANIQINLMKQITVRSTYGLLDYFSDIGGLVEFLSYVVAAIFTPFWNFTY